MAGQVQTTQSNSQTQTARVFIIGRGAMSPRQKQLLEKAIGPFEIVGQIEQVNSPKDITNAINETNANVVFTFVLHPTVVYSLETARKILKGSFDYYAPQTEAIWTKECDDPKKGEEECHASGGDVVVTKIINGKVSVRCVRTARLWKNPVLKIEAEEVVE